MWVLIGRESSLSIRPEAKMTTKLFIHWTIRLKNLYSSWDRVTGIGLRGNENFQKILTKPQSDFKADYRRSFLCSIKPSFSMDNGIISKLNGFESKPLTVKVDGPLDDPNFSTESSTFSWINHHIYSKFLSRRAVQHHKRPSSLIKMTNLSNRRESTFARHELLRDRPLSLFERFSIWDHVVWTILYEPYNMISFWEPFKEWKWTVAVLYVPYDTGQIIWTIW